MVQIFEPQMLTLRLPGPLDLKSTLKCGQAFRWERLFGSHGQAWYEGIIGSVALRVRVDPSGQLVVLYDDRAVDSCSFAQDVFDYFSLDDDLGALHQFLRRGGDAQGGISDKVMEKALEYGQGLRILRQDPWECLVSYIISANNNIPAITKIVNRISAALGSPAGLGLFAFPPPEEILKAGLRLLKESKCGYRAPYIMDAATKVFSRQVDLDEIRNLETDEARRRLLTIKGVGPKIADCVLLFAYHRLEVFPVDVWVRRSMSEFYFHGADISPEQSRREGSKRFGKCAGYAQQVLFNYSRNILGSHFK